MEGLKRGRDYDTGLTVGEWVIHGSCYDRLEKKFIFTKTKTKLMKRGL